MTTATQSAPSHVDRYNDLPIHPNPNYPVDFESAARDLICAFPSPDICETLAMKSLERTVCLLLHLEQTCPDIHPFCSDDPEIRRAYAAAERSYLRFLSYLQRRLDHRARLAARAANPSDAYANTLYKPDSKPINTPSSHLANPPQSPTPPASPGPQPATTPSSSTSNHTQAPAKTQVTSQASHPSVPHSNVPISHNPPDRVASPQRALDPALT